MKKFQKIIVSFFILFNFLCMLRTFMPLESRFFSFIYRPVDSYLSFFSFYQDWMMFAPNPGRRNVYLTAEVEFDTGERSTYYFPRPWELSLFQKYLFGERYRKIISEAITRDSYRFLWTDTARFVLHKMKEENLHKIPTRVHLIRHLNFITDHDVEFRPHAQVETNYLSEKFYTYEVF
jgi:hypothetical protein